MEGLFNDLYLFNVFFFNTVAMKRFSIPFTLICISFLFNWIKVKFKLHTMSFKWNLIFSKSIHFFIYWLTLVVHSNMEPINLYIEMTWQKKHSMKFQKLPSWNNTKLQATTHLTTYFAISSFLKSTYKS